ncbi:putative RNA-directed DNA polymerase, eukaryota, reverse transcriptase zinc-binding domain protein [Tanacetum coccineum]
MQDGVWITDLVVVKEIFADFFEDKFKLINTFIPSALNPLFKQLPTTNQALLEASVTHEEIKEAVWSCSGDKAWALMVLLSSSLRGYNASFITLIPKIQNPLVVKDYRPISLLGIQYKIIAKVLATRLAKVVNEVVRFEQTTSIQGRQILDGPLMLSEIVDWYKKKRKKLIIFIIDFEKAFDSLSWEYLDHVMSCLGFGSKWRGWIQSCLSSARSSAMEGLHVAVEEAMVYSRIRGVLVGSRNCTLPHLLYANDVIFVNEWSHSDISNITSLLWEFYNQSGLKINMQKSNLFGIVVEWSDVQAMAELNGCIPGAWAKIVGVIHHMNDTLIIPWETFVQTVGNGSNVKFWLDEWVDNQPLKDRKECRRQIRGGREQEQLQQLLDLLQNLQLSDDTDSFS